MPRYTNAESIEMISHGIARATANAAAVLPAAVGPSIAATSGLRADAGAELFGTVIEQVH